jgi:hypothetical protein
MKRYKVASTNSPARGSAVNGTPDPMGVDMGPQDSGTLMICKVLRIALVAFSLLMVCLILFAWLNNPQ